VRIPGVKTAKHFSRWIQARLLGGALILGYHRVANAVRDEYEVCVAPKHFAEQMEALSKVAQPISLSELVKCLKAGPLPPKAMAVTFDDGYADNLYEAKPVLERYAIPATVFVCTGYAGREFWWDELDRLVMSTQADLAALRLWFGKNSFSWDQPNGSPEADLESRKKFRHVLYHILLELDVEEQGQVMSEIRNWSGMAANETTARTMTHEELLRLADGGLIQIGSHTRFHPMLQHLSMERQMEEIISGRQELEEILGRRVEGFAYPNGKATNDAERIVRESGFSHACTSEPGLIRNYRNRHQIPRFWPRDWDGRKFTRWLRRWL
jgi:peptidoglycan/xylan/chitin deacetylase (PgdA/CDA1 family)